MTQASDKTTHFGFQTVAEGEKAGMVHGVFSRVAGKYDVMNDLMSLGIHRLWKRFAISLAHLRPGERVLDLAGGTGDLTSRMLPLVGAGGLVVLSDINASMLSEGRKRLLDDGAFGTVAYAQVDAEQLPFPDNTFDCITIGFGLRNVTDQPRALAAMRQNLDYLDRQFGGKKS